ncbi:UNVERIFIED_CONTAM: hypothetical protein Sradi_6852800 [Sesamum radiatum]|uniref:Uncharacterized protein n=1 Tax=Sesamum radiatum TaxID=300843 RepID=A0AAW2JL07_SESRA
MPYAMLQTPICQSFCFREGDLPQDSGGGRSQTAPPCSSNLILQREGASSEGKTKEKKEDALAGPSKGPSDDPPAPAVFCQRNAPPPPAPSRPQDLKTPENVVFYLILHSEWR